MKRSKAISEYMKFTVRTGEVLSFARANACGSMAQGNILTYLPVPF